MPGGVPDPSPFILDAEVAELEEEPVLTSDRRTREEQLADDRPWRDTDPDSAEMVLHGAGAESVLGDLLQPIRPRIPDGIDELDQLMLSRSSLLTVRKRVGAGPPTASTSWVR